MKKLYDFLRILQWTFVGVFLGRTGYTFWHYKTHPEFYAMQSAPWYLSVEIQAVFTVAVVLVLLLLRWAIQKKLKQSAS